VRPVGKVKVKGKKELVQVYEVLWEETGLDLSAAPPPHIQSHRITRSD
jgi:hypothetical protein